MLGAGLSALAAPALAQGAADWPSRPLRLVVSQAPGGGSDVLARVFATGLGARVGKPVVVENRTGAAGNLATEFVAAARPDGTTFLWGIDGPIVVNPNLFPNLRVDPDQALEPVALLARAPLILVVAGNSPYQRLSDLVAAAKARPGTVSYGSAGHGTAGHLGAALFGHAAGLNLIHVPYRGAAPALNELLGGQTQFVVTSIPSVAGMLAQGGQIRALGVTTETRVASYPDVPTVAEAGFPGYRAAIWYGILAPRGTEPAIIERMAAESAATINTGDIRDRLASEGAVPHDLRGDAFRDFLRSEREHWARVIRETGLTVE